MLNPPLVSVIVPVYNGAAHLRETLDSLLAQDHPALEVLVVDDGSTDDSLEVARSYGGRLTVVTQPNQGVAGARNTGIRQARGNYLTFCDQDDLWSPDKTTTQLSYLEAHPECAYVLSRMAFFLHPGVERPSWLKPELLAGDYPGYHLGAMLARRELFGTVGTLDARHRYTDDVGWFFEAKDRGIPMHHLPEVVLFRRVHGGNNSAQVAHLHRELLAIARRSVDRQRRAARTAP
ncbi:MAG: glycosyltransferase family A protein [Lentisphaeria bacterium]